MRIWYSNALDNNPYVADVEGSRVRIGRAAGNDIVLNSPYVAEEAAVLYKRGPAWELRALGLNEIRVGEADLFGGDVRPVKPGEMIKLFPFTLMLDLQDATEASGDVLRLALEQEWAELVLAVHLDLLSKMDLSADNGKTRHAGDEFMLILERNIEEIAKLRGFFDAKKAKLVEFVAGHAARGQFLGDLIDNSAVAKSVWDTTGHWSRLVSTVPEREQELAQTIAHLGEKLKVAEVNDLTGKLDRVDRGFWPAWQETVGELHRDFKRYLAQRRLKKEIKDIVFGYGPLEDLLRMPTVSEIMVVDCHRIYIEKGGVIENSGRRFISDEVTISIIERIVAKVGRRIDKSSPLVDARLIDGSRVNAVIPPLAVSGPCLTIRKFPARKLLVDDLIAKGSLTRTAAEFLRAAVVCRKNILIAGGTGTGKTTLLNCLSDFIPDKERIVTVEDTAELQLKKEHVVRMETKESNVEGAGAYSIRDLVKNALRMRPDRIVVGECRGPEALDMLQAMNTGHDGSLTTIHANNAADVVLRLEVLVQMAADLPVSSIHRQISSAIDLVVQLTRLRDGRRVVSQITEITPCDEADGGVRTKDLFLLETVAGKPLLCPTGALPTFMGELISAGKLQLETFYRA